MFLSVTLLGSEHAHTVLTSTYSLFRLPSALSLLILSLGSPIRSFSSFSRARRPASLSSGSPPRMALGLHSPTRLQQWLATLIRLSREVLVSLSVIRPHGSPPCGTTIRTATPVVGAGQPLLLGRVVRIQPSLSNVPLRSFSAPLRSRFRSFVRFVHVFSVVHGYSFGAVVHYVRLDSGSTSRPYGQPICLGSNYENRCA